MDQASSLRKIVKENKIKEIKNKKFEKQPKIFAITSGKGGVGKSNVVGNVAVALSKQGKKVLILDGDLGLANIDILFSIAPEYDLSHLISGEKQLEEIVVNVQENISLIPAGSGFANLTSLTDTEKLNLVSAFDGYKEEIDYVLIDTGAGVSSNVLYFNLSAEERFVVVTPEPTSIADAYAIIKILSEDYNISRFKLIINIVKDESEAKKVFQAINRTASVHLKNKSTVIEYFGHIPFDNELRNSVSRRQLVVNAFPNSYATEMFFLLSKKMISMPKTVDSKLGISFFMQKIANYKT